MYNLSTLVYLNAQLWKCLSPFFTASVIRRRWEIGRRLVIVVDGQTFGKVVIAVALCLSPYS